MLREKFKQITCKNESTDAVHGDGLIGSSDEAPVMGVERSNQIIQPIGSINLKKGGINARGKVV
jgi:hypothetical protein